jgi:hypothetical protein
MLISIPKATWLFRKKIPKLSSFSSHQSLPIPWCVNWNQTDSNRKESPLGDPVRNCPLDIWRLPPFKIPYLGVYWSIYPTTSLTSLKNSAENLWRFLFNDSVWSISDVHCPTLMLLYILYFISFGSLIPFNSGVKFQEGEPFHQKWDETCLTLSHHLWWCWFIHHLWLVMLLSYGTIVGTFTLTLHRNSHCQSEIPGIC